MGTRVTPVEASKQLGIRPQMVYGFIKHHRVHTFPNPNGKAELVDLEEVKSVTKGVKPHRPKGTDGKLVKRSSGVKVGTILSGHAKASWETKARPHRTYTVDRIEPTEEGNELVFTRRGDGTESIVYEQDELAEALAKGRCHIESAEALLSAVEFHWMQEDPALAGRLREFIKTEGLLVPDLNLPAPPLHALHAGT